MEQWHGALGARAQAEALPWRLRGAGEPYQIGMCPLRVGLHVVKDRVTRCNCRSRTGPRFSNASALFAGTYPRQGAIAKSASRSTGVRPLERHGGEALVV